MAKTTIPGIKAQHAIISDVCIETHGSDGAFAIAVDRLKKEYDRAVKGWRGQGAKLHLVLVVQRPGHDDDKDV